jgi:hypothetical protein
LLPLVAKNSHQRWEGCKNATKCNPKKVIMGGSGSGNRYRWDKKTTVEECRVLDVFSMARDGLFAADSQRFGTWVWYRRINGERVARIGYEVNTIERPPWLRLYYTVTPWNGEKQDYDYRIWLRTTPCTYGGRRWWFTCPLTRNGRACGRRVGKLYFPPGGRYYGCRHCYDLTYESCQQSDKRVSAFRKDTDAWLTFLQRANESGNVHDIILTLKVAPDRWFR